MLSVIIVALFCLLAAAFGVVVGALITGDLAPAVARIRRRRARPLAMPYRPTFGAPAPLLDRPALSAGCATMRDTVADIGRGTYQSEGV